jgi:hypothetical protein
MQSWSATVQLHRPARRWLRLDPFLRIKDRMPRVHLRQVCLVHQWLLLGIWSSTFCPWILPCLLWQQVCQCCHLCCSCSWIYSYCCFIVLPAIFEKC